MGSGLHSPISGLSRSGFRRGSRKSQESFPELNWNQLPKLGSWNGIGIRWAICPPGSNGRCADAELESGGEFHHLVAAPSANFSRMPPSPPPALLRSQLP